MVFRLEQGETIGAGLGRVATEETRRARGALLSDLDPEAGVLEARKSFKKVRAILRFSRGALGKPHFRSENVRFRDLGRRLAPQRAAAARFQTLDRLETEGAPPDRVLQGARRRLATRRRRRDDASVRAEVARALTGGGPGFETVEGFEALASGLARTYRKGGKRMRDAIEAPSAEAFHEWRKRVKDLWYQVRLLRNAWPEVLDSLADELHRLSRHLGAAHDLDLLEAALREEARLDLHFDPSPLFPRLEAERAAERDAALELGRRLYAEDPEGFVTRIEGYWHGWHESEIPVA
jgi:hypothetical protein